MDTDRNGSNNSKHSRTEKWREREEEIKRKKNARIKREILRDGVVGKNKRNTRRVQEGKFLFR